MAKLVRAFFLSIALLGVGVALAPPPAQAGLARLTPKEELSSILEEFSSWAGKFRQLLTRMEREQLANQTQGGLSVETTLRAVSLLRDSQSAIEASNFDRAALTALRERALFEQEKAARLAAEYGHLNAQASQREHQRLVGLLEEEVIKPLSQRLARGT